MRLPSGRRDPTKPTTLGPVRWAGKVAKRVGPGYGEGQVLVFDAGTNGAQVDPPGSGSGLAILDNLHLKADERGGARHYVNQNQFFRLTR
jgi:hypothetical protein